MQKIDTVVSYLNKKIPEPECELNYSTHFQLFIAAMLSPQCTDKRVNIVTKDLFMIADTAQEFARMPQERLEKLIYSTGFYKNKAKNIIASSKEIYEKYDGEPPKTAEELERLPGVGRKIANVIASLAYGANAFAVDTHVFRVTNRLGIVDAKTPAEVEKQMWAKYPEVINSDLHHRFVLFGRYTCIARKPKCVECGLRNVCDYYARNAENNKY